jgi:hypothetical protein
MTAQVLYGHKNRDAMVAESEVRPFDLLMSEEVAECFTEHAMDPDRVFTAVTLIKLMGFLG